MLAIGHCWNAGFIRFGELGENKRLHPEQKSGFCRVEVVSLDGKAVTSFNRQPVIPASSIADCTEPDLIIVPGMLGKPEKLLEYKELIAWIGQQYKNSKVVASACTGGPLSLRRPVS